MEAGLVRIRRHFAEDESRKWHIRQSVRALNKPVETVTMVIVLPQRKYWDYISDYVLEGLDIVTRLGSLGSGDLEYITRTGNRILIRDEQQDCHGLIDPQFIRWRQSGNLTDK